MFRQLIREWTPMLAGVFFFGFVAQVRANDDVEIPPGRLVCFEFFVPESAAFPELEDPRYSRLLGAVSLGDVLARVSVVPTRPGIPAFIRLARFRPGMAQGFCPYPVDRECFFPSMTPRIASHHFTVRDELLRYTPIGQGRLGTLLRVTLNEGPSAEELSVVMRVDSADGTPPMELERLFELGTISPVHYLTISPDPGDTARIHRVVFLRWERVR